MNDGAWRKSGASSLHQTRMWQADLPPLHADHRNFFCCRQSEPAMQACLIHFQQSFPLEILSRQCIIDISFLHDKMHSILVKTFGGLSRQYYFRQLFFAALMAGLLFWAFSAANETHPERAMPWWMLVFVPLYPYSRFVYESVVGFIVGDNVFFVNAILLIWLKIVSMLACLILAPVIAPIGLIYLYFYHRRHSA